MMHGFSHSNPLLVILAYFQLNLTPNLHFIFFYGEDDLLYQCCPTWPSEKLLTKVRTGYVYMYLINNTWS